MKRIILAALLLAAAISHGQEQTTPVDRTVNPCVNFYQYACNTWLKNNPVPADQPRWARFDELQERNNATLRQILEKAMTADGQRSPVDREIGDYYAACMDEAGIERRGAEP